MSSSVNRHEIIGRLGADPESRSLNSGDTVVSLRVATSDTWRDKQTGEKREKTAWHTVVIFNQPIGKIAEQYLRKGHLVRVVGKVMTRKWEDQHGNSRYATETVLEAYNGELTLLPQGSGQGASSPDDYGQQSSGSQSDASSGTGNFSRDLDDEIPF